MMQKIQFRSVPGNRGLFLTTYIGQLLSSKPIFSLHDVRKLGEIFNKVESNVKNLRTLHIDSGQNGPVLVSTIMSELQN